MKKWMTFESFGFAEVQHAFSLRRSVSLDQIDFDLSDSLSELAISPQQTVQGEQTHGNEVAVVNAPSVSRIPRVDALITATPRLALVVRVADCGPLFFYDPRKKIIAVAHSGRKGTELNIARETILKLRELGSSPADLIVQLGPCIRPPHYEVAFAEKIGDQVRSEGVKNYFDCRLCTGSDLDRFYSYRLEKGKTGRMWGVLMLV